MGWEVEDGRRDIKETGGRVDVEKGQRELLGENGGRGFFFQAEDGIRELVRSRGLGDVYRRLTQC